MRDITHATATATATFDALAAEVGASLVVPPVARITSAARHRRKRQRRTVAASAVTSVAFVVGVSVVLGGGAGSTVQPAASASASGSAAPSPATPGTYRALVEDYVAGMPDRPVVVPRTLPAGYAMLNPFDYYPTRPGLPGIRLCVPPVGASARVECVGTADDSPYVEVVADGVRVVLVTSSPPETVAALEVWKALTFTTQWRSVAWLDQPRHDN